MLRNTLRSRAALALLCGIAGLSAAGCVTNNFLVPISCPPPSGKAEAEARVWVPPGSALEGWLADLDRYCDYIEALRD